MELTVARAKGESYILYVIQNGDTFQLISIKFYGTNKYWLKIYEDNKNSVDKDYSPIEGREIKINTNAGADDE
jgi:nucleoid-associated protein YgaU